MSRLDAIKALRMKLKAKKVAGRYKGKSSVGGEFRSVKPFNPSLHPRGPGGKFVPAGAGAKKKQVARPGMTDRANRLVKKISDRAHKMEPSTIDRRVDRIGNVLNAKEVAAVEKQQLSANVGKTKAEKLAEIRRQIHNRRKSRDRIREIDAMNAPRVVSTGGPKAQGPTPSLKEQAAAHRAKKGTRDERVATIHDRRIARAKELAAPSNTLESVTDPIQRMQINALAARMEANAVYDRSGISTKKPLARSTRKRREAQAMRDKIRAMMREKP